MNTKTSDGGVPSPYRDASLPVDQRVEDLLGRMTLEDKAGLMFHSIAGPGDLGAPHPIFGGPPIGELVRAGRMNHFNIYGASGQGTAELAQWHNAVQRLAADQPLGIPVTLSSDPRHHFIDNPFASMFMEQTAAWPEPLGLARHRVGGGRRASSRTSPARSTWRWVCGSVCIPRSTWPPNRDGAASRAPSARMPI